MTAIYYVSDVFTGLAHLPENSVDLVLSSPPFLALRSYLPQDHPDKLLEGGSQATPGEFIDWLLDVVEACDRVLAPHGSLCFELGDTYSGSGGAGGDYAENGLRDGQPVFKGSGWHRLGQRALQDDQPPNYRKDGTSTDSGSPKGGTGWPLAKSLSLIPESFRFAMVYGHNPFTGRQTAPWRLRNVIRWVRPNPPVGALGDKFRPATSELMVFCKSGSRFFDLDAVREGLTPRAERELNEGRVTSGIMAKSSDPLLLSSGQGNGQQNPAGAPPLDWWNIPPGGYPGSHYAVWPPELCVKPIKAMCPERVCVTCGEPSRRIVGEAEYVQRRNGMPRPDKGGRSLVDHSLDAYRGLSEIVDGTDQSMLRVAPTLGFSDCSHNTWRPGLVLDPFAGSGTTLAVATGHGRDAIGIDIDERNYELALDRVGPLVLQRAEVPA